MCSASCWNCLRGTRRLDVEFQVATPHAADAGRIVVTNDMLNLQWEQVLLYPAGQRVRDIPVQATLRLPEGWKHASALRAAAGTAADASPWRSARCRWKCWWIPRCSPAVISGRWTSRRPAARPWR